MIEENVIIWDFADEMKNSYRDYSMSVIVSRALPDVRDGLKPVQRRILYAMYELGLFSDKQHRKSARIVGDTMGKYHPHGDGAIYEALVNMAREWNLSLPLVDGHGNFGSIDGDGAAAMRYTEARLSKAAMEMLTGLEKDLVELVPNFDENEAEPAILPAKLPFLIINGTTGIAVGMATNIPPHNVAEVIKATMALIDNPNLELKDLMKYIKGPDFPTGGIITNADDLENIYKTGEGRLRIRGRYHVEEALNGKKNIVITEIPFTIAGNKTRLVEALVNAMKERIFEEISDIRDESGKDIRIVVEVKKDRNIENLVNGLFKKTPLEENYTVNLLALKDREPRLFSLKGILEEFISFEKQLCKKEYSYLLKRAENRHEIVTGLIEAVDVIDVIIEILRGSKSIKEAKDCLINGKIDEIQFKTSNAKKIAAKFDFTKNQADAILAMPLSRLIGLEILKLRDELEVLEKNLIEYRKILENESELNEVIKKDLTVYLSEYKAERKTALIHEEVVDYIIEKKEEDVVVLIDRFGYIKQLELQAFNRIQKEDTEEGLIKIETKNTDKICIFTRLGRLYQIRVEEIPRGKIKDRGILIQNIISSYMKEDDEAILYSKASEVFDSMLFFATDKGYVKLVSGIEFETNRQMVVATKLQDGETLVGVDTISASELLSGELFVYFLTEKKEALAVPIMEFPEFKKMSRGVRGLNLRTGDILDEVIIQNGELPVVEFKKSPIKTKKIKNGKRASKTQKI